MAEQQKSEDIIIDPKTMTVDEQIKAAELKAKLMELELKQQELDAKKLEIQERQYHIKDLRAKIAERDQIEAQLKSEREQAGRNMAIQEANDKFRFKACSHRKGGKVSPSNNSALMVGGQSNQYAVIKHQMINGDIWIRCLRCGRTWNPPVERNFFFDPEGKNVAPADGVFDKFKFAEAVEDYRRATMFETNNSMSGSVQCRFFDTDPASGKKYDGADKYRENIASTTLR